MNRPLFLKLFYWLPPIAWASAIFALSCVTLPPQPQPFPYHDKVAHYLLFAILSLFLYRAFLQDKKWRWQKAALAALALTSLYGALDEFHQYFTPARSVELADWMADTIGGSIVFLLRPLSRKTKDAI